MVTIEHTSLRLQVIKTALQNYNLSLDPKAADYLTALFIENAQTTPESVQDSMELIFSILLKSTRKTARRNLNLSAHR